MGCALVILLKIYTPLCKKNGQQEYMHIKSHQKNRIIIEKIKI